VHHGYYQHITDYAGGISILPVELEVKGGGPGPAFTILVVQNFSQKVGSIFTLESGPIFKQTVDFLTNGQDGFLEFIVRPSGGGPGFKKRHFNGGYPAVDLRGFTIEGLDLSVDSFGTQVDPGEAHITFVIRGEFPLWWRVWRHRIAVFVLGGLLGFLSAWLLVGLR
jgi:hypothetical protein